MNLSQRASFAAHASDAELGQSNPQLLVDFGPAWNTVLPCSQPSRLLRVRDTPFDGVAHLRGLPLVRQRTRGSEGL